MISQISINIFKLFSFFPKLIALSIILILLHTHTKIQIFFFSLLFFPFFFISYFFKVFVFQVFFFQQTHQSMRIPHINLKNDHPTLNQTISLLHTIHKISPEWLGFNPLQNIINSEYNIEISIRWRKCTHKVDSLNIKLIHRQ